MPFADLGGLVVSYRTEGEEDAPRLVVLNSLGTDYRIWDGLVRALGDRYRILRYDERGQGLSDSPPGPYSIADHSGDLLALLDAVGWGPTLLCGLSIGGMIAMDASARRPGAVRGLVLADTADVIGPRSFWDARMRQVREGGLERIAQPVMERWFGASFRRSRPAEARGWANLLAGASPDGYLGSCSALREADLSSSLPLIRAPALCVCGSEDLSTPPSSVKSLASRLPDAEYVEIEGAGHLSPVERPLEFARVLDAFARRRLGS